MLNGITALSSALLLKERPVITYGAQLLGYALVAAGSVARCRYQFSFVLTLWREPSPNRESPRNHEVVDELPEVMVIA